MVTEDERYMRRALELAAEPRYTSPNPRVGAVVVRDGAILSEAAHHGAGRPHAEAIAIRGADRSGATLYVTLEPCAHHGRTPPCTQAILGSGISRVVVALTDPDERVNGQGISLLRDRGIDVEVGILADEAAEINAAYLHQRTTGRPLVTLKLALTLDGKLAAADGSSRWISAAASRHEVHLRRAAADGVLIGAGTVLADNPRLTARDVDSPRQPMRVLVDSSGRVPASSRFFEGGETIVMTTSTSPHTVKTRWKEAGAEVVVLGHDADGSVDLRAVVQDLATRGWIEVFCEGGARLATSLLKADLVDRLALYFGPVMVGGPGIGLGDLGVTTMSEATRWRTIRAERVGPDVAMLLGRED